MATSKIEPGYKFAAASVQAEPTATWISRGVDEMRHISFYLEQRVLNIIATLSMMQPLDLLTWFRRFITLDGSGSSHSTPTTCCWCKQIGH
jgi:hypothetical protein